MARALFRHEIDPEKFALYSTIVDDYILIDCTLDEVRAYILDEHAKMVDAEIDCMVQLADSSKKPPLYPEPDDTPDEALRRFQGPVDGSL